MAISSMQAIKLHKAPTEDRRQSTQDGVETQGSVGQSLTMGQAEKMLKSLVEEGWFEKSSKGYYSLSPRALMELRGWLMETYNDIDDEEDEEVSKKIKQCFACKDIITTVSTITSLIDHPLSRLQGQRCPKKTCSCRLHDICTQNFFRTQKSKKCPLCDTPWTGKDFVGERAAITVKPKTRNNGSGVMVRNQKPVTVQGEEDVEDQDEDEDEDESD